MLRRLGVPATAALLPLLGDLSHVRFELVVLVFDRVEKEALHKVGAPLGFVHLVDQMVDLAQHVLEGSPVILGCEMVLAAFL